MARKLFPDAPQPWLDLSTGISPWAYPIPHFAPDCWTRLPDASALAELLAQARATYSIPPFARVLAVAGSDLAISILPRCVNTKMPVRIVSPTYSSHEAAWTAAGFAVERVQALDAIGTGYIGVVVNPNNPDGRVHQPQALQAVATRLKAGGGFLIVDEAFCDATPEMSVLKPEADLSATLVLRSFGKFFGLAGVRLGFVATAHEIGAALAQTLSDWPVSGPAIAIGTAALSDTAWADRTRGRLAQSSRDLEATLHKAKLSIVGTTPLFCLARHHNANALFLHLAKQGILVRPFARTDHLRFGLPANCAELQRLETALAAL